MPRPLPLFILVAAVIASSTGCASARPPDAETPVAEIVEKRVFAAPRSLRDRPQTVYHDFELNRGGEAWLFVRGPESVDHEISLNGSVVRVRARRPTRLRVNEGLNRLGVRVSGPSSVYVALRMVAVADRVTLSPVLDASRSPSAPLRASVQVTALGLPVSGATVVVDLLEPGVRRRTSRAPAEPPPVEPLLSGKYSLGTPPRHLRGVLARRLATTDGAGKATITVPGIALGDARLAVAVGRSDLRGDVAVVVPDIELRSPLESLEIPADSRRHLPLKLGLFGLGRRDRTVDVKYAIQPRREDGVTVVGPDRIRFDRSKTFALNPLLVTGSPGEFSLTVTVEESPSGRSRQLVIPVTVVAEDTRLKSVLFTPIAQPAGLRFNGPPARARLLARVAGPVKPEFLAVDEVDARGKPVQASIARLLDNGLGQDARENDWVYSGAASIDAAREGERYFRVSTLLGRTAIVSTPRTFLVTRFPLGMPPTDPDRLVDLKPGEAGPDPIQIFSRQVVLFLEPELVADGDRVERLAESVKGRIVGVTPAIRQYLLEFDGDPTAAAVLETIARLEQRPGVVAAYPNFAVRPAAGQPSEASSSTIAGCTDPALDCQWYIEHVRVHEAWDKASGLTPAMPIGVFEPAGVDGTHPELNGSGKCNSGNGTAPCAAGTHGTWVAGVLAAQGNDGGIAGIAWESPFYVYQESDSSATFNDSLASATQDVLNVSQDVGGALDAATLGTSLGTGKLLVAAAGNVGVTGSLCNDDVDKHPAVFNADPGVADRILSVGATDISDELAQWDEPTMQLCSNRADWVDVYAPGEDIYTAESPSGYTHVSGTSLATPIVAGAAAMLWALQPSWAPEDVHDKILGRAGILTASPLSGESLLDACAMLGVPELTLSDAAPTIESECSAVTVAQASDPDLDDPFIAWDSTDQLSYAFDDGGGNSVLTSGPFEIDATTGVVSVLSASCPLAASPPMHNLTVRVTDSIGMTDEEQLVVHVQQVFSNYSGTIDFETPAMGASEGRRGMGLYVAGSGAVSFEVHDLWSPDAVAGLVRNNTTSACVEPSSVDQTLGTGRNTGADSGDNIGLSGFQIRATFAPPLQPNAGEQVQVGADFQALTGTEVRIRLFDAGDNEVGVGQSVLSGLQGDCGFPGGDRAQAIITATTTTSVAYAVFDVPANDSFGGTVFVIDDVSIAVSP